MYLKKPPDGDWTTPVVIDSEGSVGLHTSLAAGLAVHVAYQDYVPNYDLKYAMICP